MLFDVPFELSDCINLVLCLPTIGAESDDDDAKIHFFEITDFNMI